LAIICSLSEVAQPADPSAHFTKELERNEPIGPTGPWKARDLALAQNQPENPSQSWDETHKQPVWSLEM
jgi:hypothetical protein